MSRFRHPGRVLDAYVDGELDDRAATQVAAHLGRCPMCRQRASLTGQIRRSLQTMALNRT
jgi:anti-sigma factor RsiW